jgi:predicted negative regulator of RcsB-dependent stress response
MAQKKSKKGLVALVVIVLVVALGWGGFKGYQWWAQNVSTVEEKAKDYADMIVVNAQNEEELNKVFAEIDAYYNPLSEEDKAKFDKAMEEYMTGKAE